MQFIIMCTFTSRVQAEKMIPLLSRRFNRAQRDYTVIREETIHNAVSLKKKSDVFFRIVVTLPKLFNSEGEHLNSDGELTYTGEQQESAMFLYGVIAGMSLSRKESQKKAGQALKERAFELERGQ